MSKQLKINKIIGIGLLLVPMISVADSSDTTSTGSTPAAGDSAPPFAPALSNSKNSANEMEKDVWLAKIKAVVPEPICKGFMEDASIAARLKEKNISYDNCVSLIPGIADKCQKKYYDSLPAMINQESASKWGRTIGECIGGDFAINYLYSGDSSGSSNSDSTSSGSSTPAKAETAEPAKSE
jgi:hypothetical protein